MSDFKPRTDIKELTRSELVEWLDGHGIAAYRADQILKWVYLRQADDFQSMTDLGKSVRSLLAQHFTIDRLLPDEHQKAALFVEGNLAGRGLMSVDFVGRSVL